MSDNIQRPLFDGVREVRGLWFDVPLIGEDEARRRIFRNWEAGAKLYRELGGYVLEFPAARLCRCDDLDGAALCEVEGLLSSAPLTSEERSSLPGAGTQGMVCLVRDAQAEFGRLDPSRRIDPAIWLDLRHIPVREPLRPPVSTEKIVIDGVEKSKSVREILGDAIPPPSEAREAFLRDAALAKEGKGDGKGKGLGTVLAVGAGVAALGLLGLLAKLTGVRIGTDANGTDKRSNGGTTAQPKQLSPWARRLNDAIAKLTMMTGVSKLLGKRQADYMRRMLDMFEDGDLLEALRHAIPLQSPQGGAETVQAYGVPGRRDNLNITRPGGVTSTIGMGPGLDTHLRQLYRKTFERLDREGRIDEAVYVLAELLKSGMEAVTYLERKERFLQAAELAEMLDLPPDTLVRLWWLVGNVERVITIARRSNSLASAVMYLEKTRAAEAPGLRKLWAQHLAAQGNLTEAVAAIWPLADERHLAREWLLEAEKSGGTLGVRALALKLALMPETLESSVKAIETLLQAEGEQAAMDRANLARAFLMSDTSSTATKRVAAELLRVLLPERQAGLNQLDKRAFDKLMTLADAPVLQADLPTLNFEALPQQEGLMQRKTPLVLQMDERGLQPICEARFLADGQYLLALGESGVLRVDQRGRTLAHYPVPAHHLVIAQNGRRALALAQRDSTLRIARLDLVTARVQDWISLPLRYWAHCYDGVTWTVVLENRLVALDTTSDRLYPTWQIADLPGKIVGFVEDHNWQALLLQEPDGQLQQWRYILPSRRLNQRDILAPFDSDVRAMLYAQHAEPLKISLMGDEQDSALLVRKAGKLGEFRLPLGELKGSPVLKVHGSWLAILTSDGYRARCRIVDVHAGTIRADLTLLGAQRPLVNLFERHAIFGDSLGRLIDIDFATGIAHSLIVN